MNEKTIYEKYDVLQKALLEVGRMLRQNPPSDLNWFFENNVPIDILAGGKDDPDGMKWIAYFIHKALEQEKEEN